MKYKYPRFISFTLKNWRVNKGSKNIYSRIDKIGKQLYITYVDEKDTSFHITNKEINRYKKQFEYTEIPSSEAVLMEEYQELINFKIKNIALS